MPWQNWKGFFKALQCICSLEWHLTHIRLSCIKLSVCSLTRVICWVFLGVVGYDLIIGSALIRTQTTCKEYLRWHRNNLLRVTIIIHHIRWIFSLWGKKTVFNHSNLRQPYQSVPWHFENGYFENPRTQTQKTQPPNTFEMDISKCPYTVSIIPRQSLK